MARGWTFGGYGVVNPAIMGDFEFHEPGETRPGPSNAPAPAVAPPPPRQPAIEERRPAGPGFSYKPFNTSLLDGSDAWWDDSPQTVPDPPRADPPRAGEHKPTQGLGSGNPYLAAIEARHDEMSMAFLRTGQAQDEKAGPSGHSIDDHGFGQRYHFLKDTEQLHVSQKRVPANILSGEAECVVCTDVKDVSHFPRISITKSCEHSPSTCLECVSMSIQSDLNNKLWNEIQCPECGGTLEYDDVQQYADQNTKERYQALSFRNAVQESDNFMWCPSGCGYGQCHEGSNEQPIVTCLLCHQKSCFRHGVVWHENLTCDEFDQLMADPINFRSRYELDNEEARQQAELRRIQEDADRVFAQGLVAEDQRMIQEEKRRREAEEERRRKEKEEREIERMQAAALRDRALRKKDEEEASKVTVARTSKPCPGCTWPIEKNDGCSHMTCLKCKFEFCYHCLVDHQLIIKNDNSWHKPDCRFHPSRHLDGDLDYQEYYVRGGTDEGWEERW